MEAPVKAVHTAPPRDLDHTHAAQKSRRTHSSPLSPRPNIIDAVQVEGSQRTALVEAPADGDKGHSLVIETLKGTGE